MGLLPVSLPCTRCGQLAVQIRQPEMRSDIRGFLNPVVKLASLKFAKPGSERVELPPSGNLLELIPAPLLSQLFDVVCATCVGGSLVGNDALEVDYAGR